MEKNYRQAAPRLLLVLLLALMLLLQLHCQHKKYILYNNRFTICLNLCSLPLSTLLEGNGATHSQFAATDFAPLQHSRTQSCVYRRYRYYDWLPEWYITIDCLWVFSSCKYKVWKNNFPNRNLIIICSNWGRHISLHKWHKIIPLTKNSNWIVCESVLLVRNKANIFLP